MVAIENDRRVALKATISSTTAAARYGRAQSSHERPAKAAIACCVVVQNVSSEMAGTATTKRRNSDPLVTSWNVFN